MLRELSGRVKLVDYPLLVRLNPNIPWRTRGNAATAVRVDYDGDPADLLEVTWQLAVEYTTPRPPLPGKSPGVVVAVGRPWDDWRLRSLYHRALTDVVLKEQAEKALNLYGALYRGGRGVIGAAAALSALAPGDPYTFELTFYRRPEMWGQRRCVDFRAAAKVDGDTSDSMNNLDLYGQLVSAAPGGPDPVLAGFRGTRPGELWKFEEALCERPHMAVLYRSNQHTGVHNSRWEARPYRSVVVEGHVASAPLKEAGGHVVIELETSDGRVDVSFYRETGPLAEAAELLAPGDLVEVRGGVRPYSPRGRPVIAAEYMRVIELAEKYEEVAPRCPKCGHRMESAGRGRGYRCPSCGYVDPTARPLRIPLARRLLTGEYTVGLGRLRHLSPLPGVRLPRWPGPLTAPISVDEVLKVY